MSVHSPLRLAVIGYGFVAHVFHAQLISQTDGLELAAIVAPAHDQAAQARTDYPSATVYEDIERFFADIDQYDAVSIGTPNATHVAMATRILRAGKPVVVDKPAAESAAEARKIIAVSEQTGVAATVFQNRRNDSEILSICKYMQDLDLGRIVRFESRYRFFRPQVETGWREQNPNGDAKGVLFDLGAHILDQAVKLFGPISSVYGEVEKLREGAAVPDDFFIAARHANGVISHVQGTLVSSTDVPRLVVQGTKGSLQVNSQDPEEDQLKEGMKISDPDFGVMPDPTVHYVDADGKEHILPAVKGNQPLFYQQWRNFLNGEGAIPVDINESVDVLELLEKALTSSESLSIEKA